MSRYDFLNNIEHIDVDNEEELNELWLNVHNIERLDENVERG